jgi:ribulose-phosphate 3-epimerase
MDIHSPLDAIEPFLGKLQVVVVMSVEPGFGGQKFVESAVKKVRRLNNLRNLRNLGFKVCVDGGIRREHLEDLEKAGVDEVVVGERRLLEWQ